MFEKCGIPPKRKVMQFVITEDAAIAPGTNHFSRLLISRRVCYSTGRKLHTVETLSYSIIVAVVTGVLTIGGGGGMQREDNSTSLKPSFTDALCLIGYDFIISSLILTWLRFYVLGTPLCVQHFRVGDYVDVQAQTYVCSHCASRAFW